MTFINMAAKRRRQRAGESVPPTAATLSALGYAADLISVTTDTASGTIYYLLHNSVTPLSGSAIKTAVLDLSAVGGGTLDPLDTDNVPVDWTAVTPGTYWINMVQESAGGFSNVVFLEVTIANFDPATLPGAEVVVDVSDITTLWQDTAGTTQVTTSGQTVGSVTNRGTLGGLFANTGGTDEPVYTDASGRKHLDFDGSNDYLLLNRGAGAAFNLSGGYTLWLVAFDDGTSANQFKCFAGIAASGADSSNSAHGVAMLMATDPTDGRAIKYEAGLNNSKGITSLIDNRTTSLPWSYVEFECVPTAASPNYWLRVEKSTDGGAPVTVGSGSTSGGAPDEYPDGSTNAKLLALGARLVAGSPSNFGKSSIAAMVIVAGALSTTDRDAVRAWCRTRAGF